MQDITGQKFNIFKIGGKISIIVCDSNGNQINDTYKFSSHRAALTFVQKFNLTRVQA